MLELTADCGWIFIVCYPIYCFIIPIASGVLGGWFARNKKAYRQVEKGLSVEERRSED
jgi:hypothetical protein